METASALRAALQAALAEAEHARGELARSERFMAAVLESVQVGIVTCDADGGHVTRNRALREMQGLSEDGGTTGLAEAASRIEVRTVEGELLTVDSYPLLQALRGTADTSRVELRMGPVGGPTRQLVTESNRLVAPDGQLLGAVACLTDVTAERLGGVALASERARLADAQRLGRLGSLTMDIRTGEFTFSDELLRIRGVPPGADLGALRRELIVPEDRDRVTTAWELALSVGGQHQTEYRIRRPDGQLRHLRADLNVTLDEQGRPAELHGTHLDITDLVVAEQKAREASAFTSAILAATPDYTFVLEIATGVLLYGSKDHDVLGLSTQQVMDLGASASATLIHPDEQVRLRAANVAAADLADGEVIQIRYRGQHADGSWRWLSRRITPFRRAAEGRVVEVLGVLRDVTDLVEVEDRLTHAALHDMLTGLPNRALLTDRLGSALARADRQRRAVAVLYCDLDGFKHINDTAGHATGDAVLVEIARRLRTVTRDHDTVARVGGDEFVVVVEPWNRPAEPAGAARKPDGSGDQGLALQVAAASRSAAATHCDRSSPLPGDRERWDRLRRTSARRRPPDGGHGLAGRRRGDVPREAQWPEPDRGGPSVTYLAGKSRCSRISSS